MKNLKIQESKIKESSLFATSIYETKLSSYGIFNQEFEKYIYNLKNKNPESVQKSNQKGWHSPNFDLDIPIITKFINKIDPIIESIINNLNWDIDKYYIGYMGIWSIINNKHSYNIVHTHGSALLSLAYYVKVPKDGMGGDFFFKDPRIMSQQRKPPLMPGSNIESLRKTHGGASLGISPQEGTLLIFPSWMEHGVRQSQSDEDRIVISANINLYPKPEKFKEGFEPNYQ